jgi:hypothetical protein
MLPNQIPWTLLLLTAGALAQAPSPLPPAVGQVIDCPLSSTGPGAFRPIGRATFSAADAATGLCIRYPRAPREVAGAVLPFPPGNLTGLQQLELTLQTEQSLMLVVSLHANDGAVHSWPAFRPKPDGKEPIQLQLADLSWDNFQNAKRKERAFAAELVQAISIVDLAGHFSRVSGDAEILLQRLTVKLAADEAQPAAPATPGEAAFFAALVHGQGRPDEVVPPLLLDAMQQREQARPLLLLGLAALWRATEAEPQDPRRIEHAMLADAYFQRVARLDPKEHRLPSWQVPAQLAIHHRLGGSAPATELLAPLLQSLADDVHFHSFAVALVARKQASDAPLFQRALAAVRQTITNQDATDATLQNRPHWPHNRQGYLLMAADLEWRAGQAENAQQLLSRIMAEPGFAEWPYRDEVKRRQAAWRNGQEIQGDDVFERQGCSVCHRAGSR